jgi:hypothetical protein
VESKVIIDEYFQMALYDLERGMTIDDMRNLLVDYEARELYEACAGIQKAIEHFRFWIVMDNVDRSQTINKIQISFEINEDND